MAVDAGWDFDKVDVAVGGPLELFPDLVFIACLWKFLDRALGRFVQVHGVCLREVLRLLQVGDRVNFGRVGLINCGALCVRVVLHDLIEEVSAIEVTKECEDVFAIFAIPERRTDALRGLCRLWNLRHEAGLFLSCQARAQGSQPKARIGCHDRES